VAKRLHVSWLSETLLIESLTYRDAYRHCCGTSLRQCAEQWVLLVAAGRIGPPRSEMGHKRASALLAECLLPPTADMTPHELM
jgi:hypothetical protein